MMRIKALYRSRGIATKGSAVYQKKQRDHWLNQLTEVGMQQRAAWLYEQLDHIRELRKRAKAAVLTEGARHRAVELLRTIPQVGPIRAAQIVATAGTPHRFRTKRQFWSYSGLAVVTHTSSEYEMREGRVVRRNKPVMCRNTNHPGKRLPSADDRSTKVSYKRPSEVTGAIRLQSTRDSLASQGARRAVEQARIADNIYATR